MLQMRKGLFGAGMPDLTGSISHALPSQPVTQPMAQPDGPKFATPGTWQNKALMVGDILLAASRGQSSPVLGQQMAMQQQAAAAQQQRGQEWDDYVRRYQYELANPKPKTTTPHYWETNNGSLGMVGPDGKPQILYQDPTPKIDYIQARDPLTGAISIIPKPMGGPLPTFTADDWNAGKPMGGPSQPATGGFR